MAERQHKRIMSERRAERKREQNKVSQRNLREIKTAYVHRLESYVQTLKASTEVREGLDPYSTLLVAHLKVLDERAELQDIIDDLKRKTLAISSELANIVGGEPTPRETSHINKRLERSASLRASYENDHSALVKDKGVVVRAQPQDVDGYSFQSSALYNEGQFELLIPFNALLQSPDMSSHKTAQCLEWTSPAAQDNTFRPIPENALRSSPMVVRSSVQFAEKIRMVCQQRLIQKRLRTGQIDSDQSTNPIGIDSVISAAERPLLQQLTSAAVNLLSCGSGIASYLYELNVACQFQNIIAWRLLDNIETRTAICLPFQPTLLQLSSPTHDLAIDFIYWPTIRDQLIFHAPSLDLDATIRDIVLSTVIDIPHRQIAVGVVELFQRRLLSDGNHWNELSSLISSFIYDPHWTFIDATFQRQDWRTGYNPVMDANESELDMRLPQEAHSTLSSYATTAQHGVQPTPRSNSHIFLFEHPLMKIQIDNACNWKLSSDFVQRYSQLECSSVTSSYRTASCPLAMKIVVEPSFDG